MGIVHPGIPQAIALDLAHAAECRVFVESGTFMGATSKWAAQHFDFVFTMERYEPLFRQHSEGLKALGNIQPLCGDSRALLPVIAGGLHEFRALHWLDAHWSGEGTAGSNDECPLLDELNALLPRANDIILIDDARLFLCAPPKPHNPQAWPGIAEVVAALGPRRHVQVIDDVIYAVPDEPVFVRLITEYAQQRSTAFWETYSAVNRQSEQSAQASAA